MFHTRSVTDEEEAQEKADVIGDDKRFNFFPHCMRDEPCPRDTSLASMDDPYYAGRRITLARSGLFQGLDAGHIPGPSCFRAQS